MNNQLIILATKLKKFNKSYIQKKHRIVTNKTVHNSSFLFFTFFLREKSFENSPYRNLLINYFKKAEYYYPGSSYFVSVYISNLILNGKLDNKEKIKTEKNINVIFNYLSTISNKKSFELFKNILYFSGADATITCESSKNNELIVEKKCKPNFKANLDSDFSSIFFSNQKETTKDFIVSIVDGFIERESEIFSLFELSKKEKLPAILICRGISENAKKNIKQMILKNKTYVYPYVLKFDNNDPFLIKDLAKSCNTEIVSSEFFDNIYKDLEEKTNIVKITASMNSLTFHEKSEELIKEINLQIKKENIDFETKKYLQKRKRRASPNNVIVRIPNNMHDLLQELKSLIKCYNYCALRGIYVFKDETKMPVQCSESSTNLAKSLFKNIKNIGYTVKIKYNESV